MNYIGEQIVFVHELKEDELQVSLDEGMSRKLNDYLKSLKNNDS
jgi:hypothetical protein